MYLVTTKHPDYVLFCMTPSERAAVGLTDTNLVRLLVRGPGRSWEVVREWSGTELSHTEFMVALGRVDEPSDPAELVRCLPPSLRG
jgi:hypothetical protein